jgi:large subunit ribosomal protein L7Ae
MSSANKKSTKPTGKTVAKAPAAAKASSAVPAKKSSKGFNAAHSHLFSKAPRNFGIGRAIPPTRDLTRFVKWPKYIRLQRQRSVLKKRLKVPPAINQFTRTLEKNQAANLFRLLAHYRPESREEKSKRLKATAETTSKDSAKEAPKQSTKPLFIKYGLNHVTDLIESKKAKLVVIAHDVDPIELVVWMPALCRKMNIPYVIVKGKGRLGHLVHKKTASVLAVTEVRKEDQAKLTQFIENVRIQFNDNVTDRKKWGGGIVGPKAQAVVRKRAAFAAKELAAKVGA